MYKLHRTILLLLLIKNNRKLTVLPVQKLTSIMSICDWEYLDIRNFGERKRRLPLCISAPTDIREASPIKNRMIIVSDYRLIENNGVFG